HLRHIFLFLTLYTFSFFFTDTATTEIYTLSLHDALPIYDLDSDVRDAAALALGRIGNRRSVGALVLALKDEVTSVRRIAAASLSDRKSTRLNSSHQIISYAVFCLKKKKKKKKS